MSLSSVCMLSVHTCPIAALGGKKTGGMNVYIRDLARELGNRNIHVDIFTRCEAKDTAEVKRLGPNVNVIHIPSGPAKALDPINIYPHLDEFTANVLVYAEKNQVKYDLIHAHYWLSGLVGLKLKQQWHIPLLQTFHTLGKVKETFLPNHQEPLTRLASEKTLVQTVDHILAFTPEEQQHLVSLYSTLPKKISLIPPGIDTNRFKPIPQAEAKAHLGISKDQQLLLFVGRLDPIKGIETLLQALALLENACDCHEVCLAIIGGDEAPNDYEGKVKQLAKDLGIHNITTFLGSREQKVLPYYYSAADMTIVPSSHESFGLVALESMACGTPVVASKVGGLQYLIKDHQTGLLVESQQPKALMEAIHSLITDPTLAEKLGQSAHLHAQNYSWKIITPQILSLYNSLLRN